MLTSEQLQARKQGIGGSDAAAIAGLSRWKTALDIYLEKLDLAEPENIDGLDRVLFGKLLEPIVAQEYERRTGKVCCIEPNTLIHPQYPWMFANIDRRITNDNAILECKTASAYSRDEWGESGSDQFPDEYLLQCAHYAIVCDVPKVELAVLIGGQNFRVYGYQRNQKLENRLIEMEHDFWHNHILKKIPPEPKTPQQAAMLWPKDTADSVAVVTNEVEEIVYQLTNTKQQIKQLEEEEKKLQTYISAFMKDASVLADVSGKLLATWKAQTTNRFDSPSLKSTHPDLYEKFIKSTTNRIFRLK